MAAGVILSLGIMKRSYGSKMSNSQAAGHHEHKAAMVALLEEPVQVGPPPVALQVLHHSEVPITGASLPLVAVLVPRGESVGCPA